MAQSYTIEQWLTGMVDYNVPESTVKAILFNNGISVGTEAAQVCERGRDLSLADLYMWLVASSSSSSGEYVSDGGWQLKKANKVVVDRGELRARAVALYKKWDSPKAASAENKVKMKNLY